MTRPQILLAGAAGLAVAAALGFGFGRVTAPKHAPAAPAAQESGRKILYWYDPMLPAERHAGPGKSSMGMELIPRFADEGAAEPGTRIDPTRLQALGVRTALVERGELPSGVTAPGTIEFNERDVAVVQARAGGFVQRVYGRAPGDVIAAGAPLVDLLVPEWAGAQGEFLAVLRTGDAALIQAARQRLQLLGMSPALIDAVERSGRVRNVVTVTTPTGGAIKTLGVRAGMSVMAGQTLAEVNGLGRVWLNAAAPEAAAGEIRPGGPATAILAAYPGQTFNGRVSAVLPQAQAESRTLTARVELTNPGGRLRPGMFATVQFGGASQPALLVPSEAVIRTGRRTLVMLALPGSRFQPAEIRTGREAAGKTEVLTGLAEGERVVASGQFLIDSEASLTNLQPRSVDATPMAAAAPSPAAAVRAPAAHAAPSASALHETTGRVEAITPTSVTLSHEAVSDIQWPAMTMTFRLADPQLARSVKAGDRVAFGFDQPPGGPTVRRMAKVGVR
ncbi:MAG TPA: efflux RND transporter periplasmic adaptor subunit [Phenylobacterium sp.]|nr:efflux RND transporter periplasmic adaptor subunit [Phenylobacterium sp.]